MDYLLIDGPMPNTIMPGTHGDPPTIICIEMTGYNSMAANPFNKPQADDAPPPICHMTARYMFLQTSDFHEYKFLTLE